MTRRSREEILELYRACRAKLGRVPGMQAFCNATGLKQAEVYFYWAKISALNAEAGDNPNDFQGRLPDEDVFREFSLVCVQLGKIPAERELRIAQRELKTRTHSVSSRFGTFDGFRTRFREWIAASDDTQLRAILEYDGWQQNRRSVNGVVEGENAVPVPQLHPFLPACIQYLDVMARGERPPYVSHEMALSTLFERRTADAFRCLGFDVQPLGQGSGRNPDSLALATRERYALIIDAKVRLNGYVLGTEDRKFLEYAVNCDRELQRQGYEKLYFVVVGSSFRESDLKKLSDYLSQSHIRSIALITATALMRIVEESIRNRKQFSLADLDSKLFGNKIISE